MRIKLAKNSQKNLILSAKNKNNLSWKGLGKEIGLNSTYVRNELLNEKRTLDSKKYYILCNLAGITLDNQIIGRLQDNWGKIKGGSKSKSKPKKAKIIAKKSNNLAEVIGIILGDGSIYVNKKSSNYQIRICGHSIDDNDYLTNYVKPVLEEIFNTQFYTRKHARNKELFLYKNSKDIIHTLARYGIIAGNKKKNKIEIPKWILKNNLYIKRCIRGLVDTDGSVYRKNKQNKYPTISITTAIPSLKKSILFAFRKLGYNPFYRTKKQCVFEILIAKRKESVRFKKEVRFKNPKHSKRFNALVV